MSASPILPPGDRGARYSLTFALFLVITVTGEIGIVEGAPHSTPALWVAGITAYLVGLTLMLVYRDAFMRLNRRDAPSWLWLFVGAVPVVGVGLIPKRGSWPVLLISAFLGVLMAVAVMNPRLRSRA